MSILPLSLVRGDRFYPALSSCHDSEGHSSTFTFSPRTTSSASRNGGTQMTEISTAERADAIPSDSQGSVCEIARDTNGTNPGLP